MQHNIQKQININKVQNLVKNSCYNTMHFNPSPLIIGKKFQRKSKILQEAIIIAIKGIVKDYFDNKKIQKILAFNTKVIEIIEMCHKNKYAIGSIRPDFLIDKNGVLKVCEINARFCTNGFIVTDYLDSCNNKNREDVPHKSILSMLNQFNKHKSIRIIKNEEVGFDIHLLKNELKSLGINIDIIKSSSLHLKNGELYAGEIPCEQFILELTEKEILSLPKNIIQHFIEHCNYMNDFRTIFIAHDKRLLSLLMDQSLMKKYLTKKQALLLQKHIIPTYSINNKNYNKFNKTKDRWVLKKHNSGKGEGMIFGNIDNQNEYENAFLNSSEIYIAQPYVQQKEFSTLHKVNNSFHNVSTHLVGMLLSINQDVFGLGCFRSIYQSKMNKKMNSCNIISYELC